MAPPLLPLAPTPPLRRRVPELPAAVALVGERMTSAVAPPPPSGLMEVEGLWENREEEAEE